MLLRLGKVGFNEFTSMELKCKIVWISLENLRTRAIKNEHIPLGPTLPGGPGGPGGAPLRTLKLKN